MITQPVSFYVDSMCQIWKTQRRPQDQHGLVLLLLANINQIILKCNLKSNEKDRQGNLKLFEHKRVNES